VFYCGVELGAVARAWLRQSRSAGRYFYAFQPLLSSRTAKTLSCRRSSRPVATQQYDAACAENW
jgi:hypothetical protein